MDQPNPSTETPSYSPELRALLRRGKGSDPSCLPEIRRALDEHPALVDQFGDLVQHIQNKLIACATASVLAQEALRRTAAQLRADLRATTVTPLEKLLADRVAVCNVGIDAADLELAHRRKTEGGDTPAVRAAERRVDSAQARFLKATRALATAQKLLRPAPSVLKLLGGKSNGAKSNGSGQWRADFNPETQGTPVAN